MSLASLLSKLPARTGEIALKLLGVIFDLVRAGDDDAAAEEALMQAEEHIKEELDRRKFGG